MANEMKSNGFCFFNYRIKLFCAKLVSQLDAVLLATILVTL